MNETVDTSVPGWMIEYRHYWIELTRIVLGALILNNGYYFLTHLDTVHAQIQEALPITPFVVAHYVVIALMAGGILLVIGMFTRVAALVQIPILLGAVFLVHGSDIFLGGAQQPEYALLVLLLLVVFFFYGGGKWSVDYHFVRRKERERNTFESIG